MQRSTTNTASLDWTDANAVREWARDMVTQAHDAIGAGEDATRPPGRRELGRRAARRIIREADGALRALVKAAGLAPERGAGPARKREGRRA